MTKLRMFPKKILALLKNKKIHLVCGGPPCNGFSVAGYRNPDDPRNLYFREFIRFLKIIKPDFFMMENVPGILTMSKGQVKNIVLSEFKNAGYTNTSVRILEAADFGVPQLRSRAIFIGNRHNLKNPYPMRTHSKKTMKVLKVQLMIWFVCKETQKLIMSGRNTLQNLRKEL